MTLQTKQWRTLYGLIVSALLLVPGLARAQLDDPGLAPPPPPPPSKPAVTPAPLPAPLPKPVVTPAPVAPAPVVQPAALAPAPVVVPPGGAPPNSETSMKEETAEDTKVTQNKPDDLGWDKLLAAPSLHGGVGLLHMMTAETGAPGSFRIGLHLQGFSQDGFLIGTTTTDRDTNQRFMGDLHIALSGPDYTFIRNFELYFNIFNSSNENQRKDGSRTDPAVILSLADVGFGIKGAYEVTNGFSIGANVGVRVMQSIANTLAEKNATSVDLNALAMLDVRKFAPKVPLRFHLGVGYYVDNSLNLLPPGQCMNEPGNSSCIRSRLVETFAYGINVPRLRTALGAEFPMRFHWGENNIFGLALFGEYHLDVGTGDGDTVMKNKLTDQATTDRNICLQMDPTMSAACQATAQKAINQLSRTTSQFLTLGLRLRPIERLIVDLGIDIGLQSPGYQFGPAIPKWNVIFGLAYAFDFTGSTTKNVTRTITRTYEITRKPPPEGKIAGTVLDVKTGKPVVGAVVRYGGVATPQATDDRGQFTSYGLPPGQVQMQVVHPDYEPVSGAPTVNANETKTIKIGLKPLPPKEGRIRVRVVDEKMVVLAGATGRFVCGAVTKDASFDGEQLVASLPPGDCTLSVDAPNFLSKERQVQAISSVDQVVELQLAKRPTKSHVTLTKDQIVISGTIHFETNKANILPDGQQILNEVVDVLAKNPQIKKVSIEGHTDNSGDAVKNLQLSKDRAKAVLDYIIKSGISAGRLQSEGYGQEKPLVPNTGATNKAKNRRVEFRILDQSGGPAPLP